MIITLSLNYSNNGVILKVPWQATRCGLLWHHRWACPPRCVLDRSAYQYVPFNISPCWSSWEIFIHHAFLTFKLIKDPQRCLFEPPGPSVWTLGTTKYKVFQHDLVGLVPWSPSGGLSGPVPLEPWSCPSAFCTVDTCRRTTLVLIYLQENRGEPH